MQTFLRLFFLVFSVALIFNQFLATETKAQIIDVDVMRLMEKQQNGLKSLSSNIKLIKYDSYLKESDVYEGRLLYQLIKQKEPLIRIDWIKPVRETLKVVNRRYTFTPQSRLQTNIVGKADVADKGHHIAEILSFLKTSTKQLKADYEVKFLGRENVDGLTSAWHLELTPRNSDKVKSIELWIDKNGMPIQIKSVENNFNSITVSLSDLQRNSVLTTVSLFTH